MSRIGDMRSGAPLPTRRSVIGGAAVALAAPALISRCGLAAEPLKVAVWDDHLSEEMLVAFRNATGIEVSLTTHFDDLETLATFGAADGTGPDIAFVTNRNIGSWISASTSSSSRLSTSGASIETRSFRRCAPRRARKRSAPMVSARSFHSVGERMPLSTIRTNVITPMERPIGSISGRRKTRAGSRSSPPWR